MGQEVFINFDVEDLKNARCRAADDLRIKKFAQLVSGDSTVYDLFLTGSSGLLNIQDYAAVRMGVGNLNQRPDSGNYTIGGSETLSYNHSAAELEAAIETITGNSCTVVQLTNFVFKITFDSVGAETVPSIDSGNLVPASSVTATVLTEGDATNQEQWLWRIYRNALAFTDSFTNISGQGIQGTLSLATPGIYDLLANGTNVQTNFEIEATDTTGNVQTIAQIPIKLNGEVIGTGFEGTVPSARTLDPSAVSFLNSFPDPTIKDSLTITADKSPDEDAKLELIDKSTVNTKQGALYKRDGSLYVGTFTDYLKNLRFSAQGTGQVLDFPADSGIRFNGGDLLTRYEEGTFTAKLESGDGTVVQENYNTNQCNYVRIGDSVQINIHIVIDNFLTAWKTSTKNWRLTGLPYTALGQHNIEIRPRGGWLDQGDNNITGFLGSSNDYLWIEKFIDNGSTPGQGLNTARINANSFVTHPFNFSTGGFSFTVTGSYKTSE